MSSIVSHSMKERADLCKIVKKNQLSALNIHCLRSPRSRTKIGEVLETKLWNCHA